MLSIIVAVLCHGGCGEVSNEGGGGGRCAP